MNTLAQPKMYLVGYLFWAGMLLAGCDTETVIVPDSDPTPPIASMTVDFTTKDGQRKTIELTGNTESVSFELDPQKPIAILASARDADGGVMGVMVAGSITEICAGDELSNILEMPPGVPDIGGPGDRVPVHRFTSFTYDPLGHCPDGNAETDGSLWTYSENYHNVPGQTASFRFVYRP